MQRFFASRAAIGNAIVAAVMVVIVAVWLVQVRGTVVALGSDVQEGVKSSSNFFHDTWQDAKKSAPTMTDPQVQSLGLPIDQVISAVADQINHDSVSGENNIAPVPTSGLPLSPDRKAISVVTGTAKATIDTCTKASGIYVTRSEGGKKYGVCMFADGSECEAVQFATGICRAGLHSRAMPAQQ